MQNRAASSSSSTGSSQGGFTVPSRWTTNSESCNIKREYTDCTQVLTFNINIKKTMKDGASLLNDFISGGVGDHYGQLFQLFLELGHRLFKEYQKYVNIQSKYEPEIRAEENCIQFFVESVIADPERMVDTKSRGTAYTDMTFYILIKRPNLPESLIKKVANINGIEESTNEDKDNEETGDNNEEDDDKGRGKAKKQKKTGPNRKIEELLPCFDANIIWYKLIQEVLNAHTIKHYNSRSANDAAKNLQPHETWKRFQNLQELAILYDFYVGKEIASHMISSISSTPLSDSDNLLSATSFFSSLTLGFARDPCCVVEQRTLNLIKNVIKEDHGMYTICFPLRKYVVKIDPYEFCPKIIHNRVLTFKQGNPVDRIAAALPMILHDFENKSNIFTSQTPKEPRFDIRHRPGKSPEIVPISDNDDNIDEARKELMELITKMGFATSIKLDAKSFDVTRLDKFGKNSLGTYLNPVINNYICAYSPIVEFSQQVRKSFFKLTARMLSDNNNNNGERKIVAPEVVLYKLRVLFQTYALKEYIERCRSVDSDISPSGALIFANGIYGQKLYEKNKDVLYEKFDPSLDEFANWEVHQYHVEHKVFSVAATQPNRLAYQYRLSAYHAKLDEIKLNLILQSRIGSAGKSYLLNRLKELSIQGTVVEETYRSDKSEASGARYMSDAIVTMQELDKTLVTENTSKGSGDGNRERMFKERLTSNLITSRVLVREESTGIRRTEINTTECITAFFAASNANLRDEMSPANYSRFHLISYEDRIHFGDILELKTFEALLSENEKYVRDLHVTESHLIQAIFFEVEKLIFCGVLEAPSVHVAHIILLLMDQGLKKRGIAKAGTRDIVRTVLLARIKCILDAICTTFFFKGAPYQGVTIQPQHFIKLEPLLFVTCQHVVSAVGEQIDLYIDETEEDVLKALQIHWNSISPDRRSYKTVYNRLDDSVNTNKFGTPHSHGIADPTYARFVIRDGMDQFASNINRQAIAYVQQIRREQEVELDNNPEKMPLKDRFEMEEVPSIFSVQSIIRSWYKKNIFAHHYCLGAKNQVIADKESKPTISMQPIAYQDKQYLYIHYEFLMGPPPEPDERVQLWGSEATMDSIPTGNKNTQDKTNNQKNAQDKTNNQKNAQDQINNQKNEVGRKAVAAVLKEILSKKHQRPQRLIFDVNQQFGFIRDTIEIKLEDISKSEVLFIASPIHMDEMTKLVLENKMAYLDKFRNAFCMALAIDLDMYALSERNKLLHRTEEIIDPSFHRIQPFIDSSKRVPKSKKNLKKATTSTDSSSEEDESMNGDNEEEEDDEETKLINARKEIVNDDDDYDEKGAYFLGNNLEDNIDLDKLAKVEDLENMIEKIYVDLDAKMTVNQALHFESDESDMDSDSNDKLLFKEQLIKEKTDPSTCGFVDDDFDPNRYIIEEATYDEEGEMLTKPVYQWQMEYIPKKIRNNPRLFKLIADHPWVRNERVNALYYGEKKSHCYPGKMIHDTHVLFKNLKKKVAILMQQENIKAGVLSGDIYVPHYSVQTDKNGVKTVSGDIYTSFSDIWDTTNFADSINNRKRKRVVTKKSNQSAETLRGMLSKQLVTKTPNPSRTPTPTSSIESEYSRDSHQDDDEEEEEEPLFPTMATKKNGVLLKDFSTFNQTLPPSKVVMIAKPKKLPKKRQQPKWVETFKSLGLGNLAKDEGEEEEEEEKNKNRNQLPPFHHENSVASTLEVLNF